MTTLDTALDPATHARIFAEEIAPWNDLQATTACVKPRAILLAGQPGCCKGALAEEAREELAYDVIQIDPFELCGYHPRIQAFQREHPYGWCADTDADTAAWAIQLRELAVGERRNLIIDTMLDDGHGAVAMIKALQAHGYDVELRALSTHRLESELSADQRFCRGIDTKGRGRHVRPEVRQHAYEALSDNLDLALRETGLHTRIFGSGGNLIYDSRPTGPAPVRPSSGGTTEKLARLLRRIAKPRRPAPPIPATLRDMLKDHPEHLQTLQGDLNAVVEKPYACTPVFEQALWALEDALDDFCISATNEMIAAASSGDPATIERARRKRTLMFQARSGNGGLRNLKDLREYFVAHRETFG